MTYIAPFLLDGTYPEPFPDGNFIVPICTTRERFKKILNALYDGGFVLDERGSYEHIVDVLNAIPRIQAGCQYDENFCTTIAPNDARIQWSPCSPYDICNPLPPGYTYNPFTVVSNSILDQIILQFGLGYRAGDVLTDISKFPVVPLGNPLEDYLNFPRFRITGIEGNGTAKIHLLNILQGGMALVTVDGVFDIFSPRIVDQNLDKVKFPPETELDVIIEVDVQGAGAHYIDVTWIPNVDDALIPLFYGGGLRKVELCGFNMSPVIDPCCPDTIKLIRVQINQQNYFYSWQLNLLDDGIDPRSFAPDAPDEFDATAGDPNPQARSDALCDGVRRYVYSVLDNVGEHLRNQQTLLDIITAFPPFIPIFGLANIVSDITAGAFNALAQDEDAINEVICHMVDNLRGEAISRPPFVDSVQPSSFSPTTNAFQVAVIIDIANAIIESYRAFVTCLTSEYSRLAAGGQSDCPCGCDNVYVIGYEGQEGRPHIGTTVEYRGLVTYPTGDYKVWRVRPGGSPVPSPDPNSQWGVKFKIVGQTGNCVFQAFDHSDNWRKDSGYIDDDDGSVNEFIGAMSGFLSGCNSIYWQNYYNSANAAPTPGYDYYVDVVYRDDLTECPSE